jgi:cytochrome c-type biogenesis protein CcmF
MLQDPGMIAHPPTLFMGYAAYTIPFAFLVGSLLGGSKNSDWLAASRWWAVFAWLFLTVGIVLGAQWAYVELGWGGYWAWDPVENASLLPWLTGTALLHSIIGQQQRGMFKQWNAWLIAATFILCVFGTYLTRSGVVQSVHSFGESLIGTFFLIFLATSTLASIVLILVRSRDLRGEHPLENLVSREGAFLATNILLVIVTAVTLVGTVFPLISGIFMKEGITVSQSFYNTCVAPMGLLLAGVMAFGPALVWGKEAAGRLARTQVIPVIVAILVAVVFAIRVTANIWAVLTAVITTIAFINIVADGIRATWLRASHHNESLAIAALRVFDNNHRRYGGQIVHVGVIFLIVGVTGSSLFSQKQDLKLKPNETASIGGYKLTLKGLEEVRKPNHTAVEASLVVTSPRGEVGELVPERLFFNKSEQSNANVAIRSTWREDLYVTLAGWENDGQLVTVQALINPLVSWIWIGGIVMTVGGIVCLLPRFGPRQAAVTPAVTEKPAAVVQEAQTRKEARKSLRSDKRKVRQ